MTNIEQSNAPGLYARLAILAIGLFIVGTNGFMIAGLLPEIGTSLGVTPGVASYSITSYALVVAILAPIVSITMSRVSRTVLMSTGLAIVAIGIAIAAGSSTIELFTLGRIVAAVGGAALVPTATAAAAMMATPERRGRAIAFVGVGFTASTAFGAPLGTAIASVSSWRVPMLGLAILAALTAVAIALFVRDVPLIAPISLGRRFAILVHPRVALALVTTLLVVCGFNLVYIFSSAVTAPATHGSGSALALLLLLFGVAGILGNVISGRLVDRFGNRMVGAIALGVDALLLALLPLVVTNFIATAVLFTIWGVAVNAATLPIQHRLVEIDPATSAIALSWFSTALYGGIAIAPLLGAQAIGLGNPELVPLIAAAVTLLGIVTFLLGWARFEDRATQPAKWYIDS